MQEKNKIDGRLDKSSPEYYTKALRDPRNVDLKLLTALRVSLTNQPISWVRDFIAVQGLRTLLDILVILHGSAGQKGRRDQELQIEYEAIRALKAFMNNKVGSISPVGVIRPQPSSYNHDLSL